MKSFFFNIFQIKEGKITAKFQSLNRVLVEDTKGFISPEKFRDVRETGSCKHKQLKLSFHMVFKLSGNHEAPCDHCSSLVWKAGDDTNKQ